jgi:hypothetical protein
MIGAYCVPLSVGVGKTLDIKISGPGPVRVVIMRGTSGDGDFGQAVHAVEPVATSVQPVPDRAWVDGCGWTTSLSLTVPAGWQSGIYAARCTTAAGESADATFVVRPLMVGGAGVARRATPRGEMRTPRNAGSAIDHSSVMIDGSARMH